MQLSPPLTQIAFQTFYFDWLIRSLVLFVVIYALAAITEI